MPSKSLRPSLSITKTLYMVWVTVHPCHPSPYNSIKPDYRINIIQAQGTPCLYCREYTVGDSADRLGRYTVAEVLFYLVTNLTCIVSQCVKPDDAVSDTFGKNSLAFLNKQGIERDIAVTGSGHGHVTHGCLDLLLHLSITTVTTHTLVICKMGIQLAFKSCI